MQRHSKNVQICEWLLVTAMVLVLNGLAAGQQIITGNGQDGSAYEIAMPAQWNGNLVLYAHGINDPEEPLVVPSQDSDFAPFRDGMVARGYAVASSSWSTNGYAVKDGVQRTHQLKGIFNSQIGKPNRVILVGKSLGGLVVVKLAEQYPSQYDGVLTMCGAVGGGTPLVQYLTDERAIFDYFFPRAFPDFSVQPPLLFPNGVSYPVFSTPLLDFSPPPGNSLTFLSVALALQSGFFTADLKSVQFALASRLQANLNQGEFFPAALSGIGFSVRFTTDLLSRTHGGIPYDNTGVAYAGSFNDAALNAGIERFTSDPNAVNFLSKYYDPTGNLQIPMLSIHTARDPEVPVFRSEDLYAGLVSQSGASNFLVQQAVNRFGHCAFGKDPAVAYTDADPTLKLKSFDALTKWISDPTQKPAGGEVTP